MNLGPFNLTLVDDGDYRLDGGAVFGAVPKVLWESFKPADARNHIAMATNSLLVERGSDLLLIDTGIGGRADKHFRERFGMAEDATRLPEAIRRAGYELGDVTHVLLTHLHFDHCGWNTRRQGDDRSVPTFPTGSLLDRAGVRSSTLGSRTFRDRASYDFPTIGSRSLRGGGQAELFDGSSNTNSKVSRSVEVPGHNAEYEHRAALGRRLARRPRPLFWADLVPTVAHLPYPWIMGYDLFPLIIMENKEKWLPRAAQENWLCFFGHDCEAPAGRLVELRPGRYRSEAVSL